MLERFYFIFVSKVTDWDKWTNSGFLLGFLILLSASLIACLVFYTWLGRTTIRYASTGKWWLTLLISSIIIFLTTLFSLAQVFKDENGSPDFNQDVWVFTLLNATVYSILIFFILSLFFRYSSVHCSDIPVRRRIIKN